MNLSLDLVTQKLLADCVSLRGAQLDHLEHLAGDASTRRYIRVHLRDTPVASVILMLLSHGMGPVKGGRQDLSQDDTFLEVNRLFADNAIRVPRILLDARDQGALLVEDVGNIALANIVQGDRNREVDALEETLGGDIVRKLFEQALQITRRIQALPRQSGHIVFERYPSHEQMVREAGEFLEHLAPTRGIKRSEAEAVKKTVEALCESINSHPKVPSHFDYMVYNIFVLPSGELCLLDYQDACLTSPARDVVSLLNDRGTDEALGKSRQYELLTYAVQQLGYGARFREFYDFYLLHWDLRVSGRFQLLSGVRGIERYKQWIPGTLRRLGRTLARSYKSLHGLEDVLEIVTRICPEAREGTEDPWEFPNGAAG